MPFSSGTFSLYTPGNPVVSGTTIASTWAINTLNDIATGLTTCILKDGSQTVTANIPMAGFKFTGLGAGTASGNSLRYEQVNGVVTTAGDILYASAAGTLARLGIGTASQVLRTNAGATAPEWVSVPTAAQTFLAADVLLSNTANYFNVCNTGSIGASGQTWLIIGVAVMTDTAGAANLLCRIWDTSTVFTEVSQRITAANDWEVVTTVAVVTPSAAATYYLSAKDPTSTSGLVSTSGSAGTANKATSITAVRLL